MAKVTLAVYDPGERYITQFLGYIKGKKLPFEAIGFTDLEILEEYAKSRKIGGLLFSPGEDALLTERTRACLTKIKNRQQCSIFLLGEQDQFEQEDTEQYHLIEKYQPMERILSELRVIQGGSNIEDNNKHFLCGKIIIGLYSPVEKCAHPSAAAQLYELSLRENPQAYNCLYLNMEPFSGMEYLLDEKKDTDISDLMYLYKTSPNNMHSALQRLKGQFCRMDVLTAPEALDDLEEIRSEDWPDFISKIIMAGDYQIIILDLFSFQHSILELILKYGKLYIPALPYHSDISRREQLSTHSPGWTKNEASHAKYSSFRKYFLENRSEEELKKIFEISDDGGIRGIT